MEKIDIFLLLRILQSNEHFLAHTIFKKHLHYLYSYLSKYHRCFLKYAHLLRKEVTIIFQVFTERVGFIDFLFFFQ